MTRYEKIQSRLSENEITYVDIMMRSDNETITLGVQWERVDEFELLKRAIIEIAKMQQVREDKETEEREREQLKKLLEKYGVPK